jgi:hypothetical protein
MSKTNSEILIVRLQKLANLPWMNLERTLRWSWEDSTLIQLYCKDRCSPFRFTPKDRRARWRGRGKAKG